MSEAGSFCDDRVGICVSGGLLATCKQGYHQVRKAADCLDAYNVSFSVQMAWEGVVESACRAIEAEQSSI